MPIFPISESELMEQVKIDKLGKKAICAKIKPIRKLELNDAEIVGFDTEYTSKQNRLICFQLYTKKGGCLYEVHGDETLTPEWLFESVCELLEEAPTNICFATYFSAAEVQFLPVLEEGFDHMEYARGFMDVSFNVGPGYRHTINIFDLCRWFDGRSLDHAAKSFNLRKLDFDTRNVTRACLRSKTFQKYAIHDARLCFDIANALKGTFIEETGVDPFTVKTPASASASAFRNLHVKEPIYCDENRARLIAMRGTWGGRAEVFKRGKIPGTVTEYDIKSAYPNSVLSLGEMPIQGSWKEVRTLNQMEKMKGGFAHVNFKFPDKTQFPCIPVHIKNAMLYPLCGNSFCTFDEISVAKEFGADIQITEAWGYKSGTRILADYLQWTMERRQSAIGAARVMYKLLGNSIIGKFAQRISKVPLNEYFRLAEENGYILDELFTLSKYHLFALGATERVSVGAVFMPEWNGLITGRTRAELALMIASCNPVYCHTDSVWTMGKEKLQSRWLKHELKISGPCTVIRTRFAGLGQYTSVKKVLADLGHVAHHSIWNLTVACQMLSKFDGTDFLRRYPKRRPLRIREAIRLGKKPGEWVEEWRTGSTKWDGKRKLYTDGTTAPWENAEAYLAALKPRKKTLCKP